MKRNEKETKRTTMMKNEMKMKKMMMNEKIKRRED